MTERKLTVAEVAEDCRVSPKTVMRAIHAGHLLASQLGERGTWVIRESAVDDWLDVRSNRTRPPRPLADVRRVDPVQGATSTRPRERARGDGDGRLAA